MIVIQGAVLGAQLVVLVLTVRVLLRARDAAARAGLAYAQTVRASQWAERAAGLVPFPNKKANHARD